MYAIEISGLTVNYLIRGRTPIKALQDISFDIDRGSIIGILGESGSGKSTLMKTILRILPNNARVLNGNILYNGLDLLKLSEDDMREIRGKRISIIPQNAQNALSPIHRIGDQLKDILFFKKGLNEAEVHTEIRKKLSIAGLTDEILNRYFFELSGGMKERVLIAMSLLCDPEIIIADELTTGLDAILQYKILKELKAIQKRDGFTMLVISHDVSAIAYVSDKVAILYGGQLFEYGNSRDVFAKPLNPYTLMLLRSHTDIRKPKGKITEIKGSPPNPMNLPSGCVFHPRCPYSRERCSFDVPPLIEQGRGHLTRCHFVNAIVGQE